MKLLLKKYFVPHPENDHRPHFLRPKVLGLLVLGILAAEGIFLLYHADKLPRSGYLAEIFSTVLVKQTNEERVDNNLSTLRTSALLTKAAQLKANDMAEKGYFSHNTPDGKDSWYWFTLAGYAYAYAGENLAVNFTDSSDVTRAWMQSPDHRANIVNGNFQEVGIATAEGTYKGKSTTFVVQLFGTPASLAAAAQQQEASAPSVPSEATSTPQVAAAVSEPAPEPAPITKPAPKPVAQKPATAPRDNFVAVAQPEQVATPTTPVAASEQKETPLLTPVANAVASPEDTLSSIYLALATILAVALFLKLIYTTARHPKMIAHGMAVIILIGVSLAVNGYISLRDAEIQGTVILVE